jgi:UDP-N-acetyl-D-mannosaminuronic acid dehydrogenase
MNTICIIGLGYIGLPTAILAAESGTSIIIGFDINEQRVAQINNKIAPIDEPYLLERLIRVIDTNTLYASTIIQSADYYIIAVPTPCTPEKKADLSFVWNAAAQIAKTIKPGSTVILESTVPVGTTKRLAEYICEKSGIPIEELFFAHCPERVLPGKIFHELITNDRVIGGINIASIDKAVEFYKTFVTGAFHTTSCEIAEMVKLVENSFRDVNIAFAHQVASMASNIGVDGRTIIELANKHPRVNILQPSCGVGGHCIALDPWFLVETFPEETLLLQSARTINDIRPHEVLKKIRSAVEQWNHIKGRKPIVLLLGLTYKPDVDDMRESPALYVAQHLSQNQDCDISVCEPHVSQEELHFTQTSLEDGVEKADIVVALVKHAIFTTINTQDYRDKVFIDVCGLFYRPLFNTQTDTYIQQAHRLHNRELLS